MEILRKNCKSILLVVYLLSAALVSPFSLSATCNPADLDKSAIAKAANIISAEKKMHAFFVKHCGELLEEQSWFSEGNGFDIPHELQSSTKTVSSLILGNLMYQYPKRFPQGVETPLMDVLPSRFDQYFAGEKNAWKQQITVKHVLSMTSGLFWCDGIPGLDTCGSSSFSEIQKTEATGFTSVDWILSQNEGKPGKAFGEFFYNTGSSHLVSAIIFYNAPDGLNTAEYADANLFKDLKVGSRRSPDPISDLYKGPNRTYGADYVWPVTPDGIHAGGWGSVFKPRTFNSFGELILNDGVWQGKRLIAADYIEAMTTQQAFSTNFGQGYGYQMWVADEYFGTRAAASRGYGGQETRVLPEYDLVITFHGDSRLTGKESRRTGKMLDDLVKYHIIPAHSKAKN